jgi:hypothetical protein
MVALIKQGQLALEKQIGLTCRAAIQAVLQWTAVLAAGGEPLRGRRRSGDVVFYSRHAGQVFLRDPKLGVERPRLRTKGRRARKWKFRLMRRCRTAQLWARGCWTSCCTESPKCRLHCVLRWQSSLIVEHQTLTIPLTEMASKMKSLYGAAGSIVTAAALEMNSVRNHFEQPVLA